MRLSVTAEILASLEYLRPLPEMRKVREWLQDSMQKAQVRAIKTDGNADFERGYALALMDLVETVERASDRRAQEMKYGATTPQGRPGRIEARGQTPPAGIRDV